MERSLRLRMVLLFIGVLFCVATLLPTVVGADQLPSWFTYLFSSKISPGTDIAGGSRFVYTIDLDKAIDDRSSELKRDIDAKLADENTKGAVTTPTGAGIPNGAVSVFVEDPAKRAKFSGDLHSTYGSNIADRPCVANIDKDGAICFRVSSDYADDIRKSALHNAVKTIRERIDENGIAEPSVVERGDEVIVELPQIGDDALQRTRDIIARTAKLEFKTVINDDPWMRKVYARVHGNDTVNPPVPPDPLAVELGIQATPDAWTPDSGGNQKDYYLFASDREDAVPIDDAKDIPGCWTKEKEEAAGDSGKIRCLITGNKLMERYFKEIAAKDPEFALPPQRQIGYEHEQRVQDSETHDKPYWRSYFLDSTVQLTGSSVSNAVTSYDPQTGHPLVLVDFNRYGGRVWGDLTAANVGKKVATILDDKIASAPIINGPIRGGRCSITMGGGSTTVQEKEAVDLVGVLKTGSLPAPLREESSMKIGATLGRDAVDKAKLSFGLGIALVVLIMVGIYRWSGTIATFAVVFHIVMTMAVMALFGATLTLPGIAAIVLSIGMEVDGNILIYERIRDELNSGKSVRGAIDLGFSRAFSAILDGQLTTAAAGWVLLQYGTGPIKGFAVMLLVGVFTTLTTNVWVTRIFFDWYVSKNTKKQGQMATISI